ncbi:TRAP transporter substrate-binding protein [Rhizobiaceae bacterium BDR2-2]|uniref:TRAP transporter substrate-binding protein n=1 Tax=Ectorhizobium quercum TaxID=2965071 RepID=A0AAE3N1D2_9HYPH|nr:TRAP transporter substrate-binding protein [Ectorhizobium quercum]MCX8998116.1 TRAP transporter substrate-binding protein [Ectorhizobium quercum]
MNFMQKITAAVFGAALMASAALAAELKFANYMAPTHPYVPGAFEPLAEKIAAETGGALTVRIYSGGELGAGPTDQYSRVVDGVAELAVGLPGYTASSFPMTLLSELPGVLTEADGTATLWEHIDVLQPEYRRVKLVSLWSSAQNLLYSRAKAVRKPEDVRGLKIRVPSRNAGLIVEAWGGSPVSMPVSDIYNALQTGVIDAAMIDGTATLAFKLGEVAQYLTIGMDTTISPFFIVMNRDAYAALPAEQQAAVDKVGREVSDLGNRVQLTEAQKGIDAFAALPGKEVIRLTPEEAAAFNALSAPVVDKVVAEASAAGVDARSVVDALKAK